MLSFNMAAFSLSSFMMKLQEGQPTGALTNEDILVSPVYRSVW